jgi:hypothetical protein
MPLYSQKFVIDDDLTNGNTTIDDENNNSNGSSSSSYSNGYGLALGIFILTSIAIQYI